MFPDAGSTPAASTSLRPPTRGSSGYGWQAILTQHNGVHHLEKVARHSLGDGGLTSHFMLFWFSCTFKRFSDFLLSNS